MFARAGSGNSTGKKDSNNASLVEVFTQAAVAISSALSPSTNFPVTGSSPAKRRDPSATSSYMISIVYRDMVCLWRKSIRI